MHYLLYPFGDGPGTWILRLVLNAFQVILLVRMVVSWLAPRSHHPFVTLIELLTEPVLKQVRQVVPPVGNLDVSPVFVFIVIDVIKWVLGSSSCVWFW